MKIKECVHMHLCACNNTLKFKNVWKLAWMAEQNERSCIHHQCTDCMVCTSYRCIARGVTAAVSFSMKSCFLDLGRVQ